MQKQPKTYKGLPTNLNSSRNKINFSSPASGNKKLSVLQVVSKKIKLISFLQLYAEIQSRLQSRQSNIGVI